MSELLLIVFIVGPIIYFTVWHNRPNSPWSRGYKDNRRVQSNAKAMDGNKEHDLESFLEPLQVSTSIVDRERVGPLEAFIAANEKADAEAYAEAEILRKADSEAQRKADAEDEAKIKRDLQKQREQDEQDERDENRVTNTIALMQRSLPFYCSVTEEEGSESHAGKLRWKDVLQAVKATDESNATLYFVKLLSLLDNKEYYKIGITTKSVEERFETSTQIELLEVVATFTAARYLVLFAEYHFIREFEITDELSKLPDMSGPDVKFSGSSEVVRANARGKISGFFEKLKGYEDKVVKGVVELV